VKGVVLIGVSVALAAALVGTAILASVVSMLGAGGSAPGVSAAATAKIPPAMLNLYQEAAITCSGLPWTILAAIGTIESDNGQSNLPGVHSGANSAGAEGPMQFEPAPALAYELGAPNLRIHPAAPPPPRLTSWSHCRCAVET
jgi:hypothetical protein